MYLILLLSPPSKDKTSLIIYSLLIKKFLYCILIRESIGFILFMLLLWEIVIILLLFIQKLSIVLNLKKFVRWMHTFFEFGMRSSPSLRK